MTGLPPDPLGDDSNTNLAALVADGIAMYIEITKGIEAQLLSAGFDSALATAVRDRYMLAFVAAHVATMTS